MKACPNIILVGPPGAGKSAVGRMLAERFDLQYVSSDSEVVKAFSESRSVRRPAAPLAVGEAVTAFSNAAQVMDAESARPRVAKKMSVSEIFQQHGEEAFRRKEAQLLEQWLNRKGDGILLDTGGGAVLRPENRQLFRERGLTVYLDAEDEVLLERIGRNDKRPLFADGDVKRTLEELLGKRRPLYREVADVTFAPRGKLQQDLPGYVRDLAEQVAVKM